MLPPCVSGCSAVIASICGEVPMVPMNGA